MIRSMERLMVDLDKRCESCRSSNVDCTYCEHYESCTKKHECIGELLASDEGFTMEEAEKEFICEKMCSRCTEFDCICYYECLYEE